MATISEIKGVKGLKYRAQVRIHQNGKLAYSEARTFEKHWQAEQWAEKREAEARTAGVRAPQVLRAERTGLVSDAKHPREKIGNHRRFVYRDEAWKIMQMQPESGDGRIFPYDPKSVGARFTRACHILGIEDLCFHDLRHEATSRLFELGMDIPEVATHTLHSSWTELKRYAQLDCLPAVYECPFLPVTEKRQQQHVRGGVPAILPAPSPPTD